MEKCKVIVDTDLGSDCDDAGALAILHNLANSGKAEILAITHCATEIGGPVTVKVINEWYGRADISIGMNGGLPFLEEERCKVFTAKILDEYVKDHPLPVFYDAIKLMRKKLVENRVVTLISVGAFNNYAALLKSEPDEISDLNGYELINQSVREMYVMGGDFEDLSHAEYNILCDVKSAQYVANNFPKPIVYCGFELGKDVCTGHTIKNADTDNPVKTIYSVYSKNGLRESWDPITVYAAINSDQSLFRKSKMMNITFDGDGKTVVKENGKDCYMIANTDLKTIQSEIDQLII